MLEESAAFAAGAYKLCDSGQERIAFELSAPLEWQGMGTAMHSLIARKEFRFEEKGEEFGVDCGVTLREAANQSVKTVRIMAGIEVILNFLAPNEPDRYFEFKRDAQAERQRLSWGGEVPGRALRVVDDWQNVAAVFEAPSDGKVWVAPIETVSESEEGFERVYQGSQILGFCPIELARGGEWTGRWRLRITKSHQ